jgi:hypothetical protein
MYRASGQAERKNGGFREPERRAESHGLQAGII